MLGNLSPTAELFGDAGGAALIGVTLLLHPVKPLNVRTQDVSATRRRIPGNYPECVSVKPSLLPSGK